MPVISFVFCHVFRIAKPSGTTVAGNGGLVVAVRIIKHQQATLLVVYSCRMDDAHEVCSAASRIGSTKKKVKTIEY
jgi:hypothetical protein